MFLHLVGSTVWLPAHRLILRFQFKYHATQRHLRAKRVSAAVSNDGTVRWLYGAVSSCRIHHMFLHLGGCAFIWFPQHSYQPTDGFYGTHHLLRPHGTKQGKARRAVVPFIWKWILLQKFTKRVTFVVYLT